MIFGVTYVVESCIPFERKEHIIQGITNSEREYQLGIWRLHRTVRSITRSCPVPAHDRAEAELIIVYPGEKHQSLEPVVLLKTLQGHTHGMLKKKYQI